MTFIREWAYCIVGTIVLFTIVEMLIPNGNMKKNAIFVFGIIASITIAEPVLKLLKSDFNIEQVFNLSDYEALITNESYGNVISSQINNLEKTFAQEIVRKFNLEYPELEILNCLVIFNKDSSGKIIDIARVNVSTYIKDETIPHKLSKLCEIDKEKITVDILEK